MKDYERLTDGKEDRGYLEEEFWVSAREPSDIEIDEIYARLAELEDKIENGTLLELPCEVGQECWFILKHKDVVKLFYGQVERFKVSDKVYIEIEALYENDKTGDYWYGVDEVEFTEKRIGNTLFFDKSEAEQKLKELRGFSTTKGCAGYTATLWA